MPGYRVRRASERWSGAAPPSSVALTQRRSRLASWQKGFRASQFLAGTWRAVPALERNVGGGGGTGAPGRKILNFIAAFGRGSAPMPGESKNRGDTPAPGPLEFKAPPTITDIEEAG